MWKEGNNMNILWVEDNPDNKKEFWFGNRNIKIITDFSEAENAIEKKLNSYDLVVLDINLEDSDKVKVEEKSSQFALKPKEFLEKSGMVLFLTLLEKGFPREQIIFLTGNADKNELSKLTDILSSSKDKDIIIKTTESVLNLLSDDQKEGLDRLSNKDDKINYLRSFAKKQSNSTYDIFCKACNAICIKPPEAISKSHDKEAQQELRSWLECHEKNDYLLLRRGIIEGCNFLKKHIQEDDANIQFRDYIKNDLETKEPIIEIETNEIINYLDSLSQFLLIKQPSAPESLNVQYRLFLRALVHMWEQNILAYNKDNPEDINTFASLSRLTRNWTSHANLLEPLNTQIVSFIFLVNMRAMFKLEGVEAYEETLFNCFPEPERIDKGRLSQCIKDADKHVNKILSNLGLSEYKVDKKGKIESHDDGNPKKKFFNQKVNDIYIFKTGKLNTGEINFKQFLLQYFWINQKNNFKDLTSSSSDFLPVLARHIYKSSFKNL